MKKRILLVTSLLVMAGLMVGCENNDDTIKCPEALTGQLSTLETDFTGTWALKSMVAENEIDLTNDNVDNPSMDVFNQYAECEKDVVYDFLNDREYILSLGNNATDCDNKLELNGTWQLTTNALTVVANCSKESIAIDFNEDKTEFSFETIYSFRDVDGNRISTKTTSTYQREID